MIYFIKAKDDEKGLIKIGATNNVEARFASIQAYCPGEIELVGAVEGTFKDEALIHRAFCRQHKHHEWFHHSDDLEHIVHKIVRLGMDSVRADLLSRAADGFGIRVKSEAGLLAIRSGRSKSFKAADHGMKSIASA